MTKRIFISWCHFSRRIASMDNYFGFEIHLIPPLSERKWIKPFGYIFQALRTARVVMAGRPDEVWLQSPPTFLPHLLLALRAVAGRFRIVADCHFQTFTPGWIWVPATIWAINHCDGVLVHNAESRPAAEAVGVNPKLIYTLEDPPSNIAPEQKRRTSPEAPPYVLAPCSFSSDEPVAVLLAAARLLPELCIMITGSRAKAERLGFTRDCPENVSFTDYLPLPEFERLLIGASVVLGLTSVEGIQLSVANEALGADKALVLSDTRILRAMFGEAALFGRNTPEDLAMRLRQALAARVELEGRSAALKARRQQDWLATAAAVAAGLRRAHGPGISETGQAI
ncbi:MAG: glycosyltransferase [Rhodobacteraceae bacterium]|nr:glycosyltransferase [Paracoccaceae bacterium]